MAERWPGPRPLLSAQGKATPAQPKTQQLHQYQLYWASGSPGPGQYPGYLGGQHCRGRRNTLLATKTHLHKLDRLAIIFSLQLPRQSQLWQASLPTPPGIAALASRKVLAGARGRTLPGLGHQFITAARPDILRVTVLTPHAGVTPASGDSLLLACPQTAFFIRKKNEQASQHVPAP